MIKPQTQQKTTNNGITALDRNNKNIIKQQRKINGTNCFNRINEKKQTVLNKH